MDYVVSTYLLVLRWAQNAWAALATLLVGQALVNYAIPWIEEKGWWPERLASVKWARWVTAVAAGLGFVALVMTYHETRLEAEAVRQPRAWRETVPGGEYPHGTRFVIFSNRTTNPTRVGLRAGTPLLDGEITTGGGLSASSSSVAPGDPTLFVAHISMPAISPATPLIVTLYSEEELGPVVISVDQR